MNSIVDMLAKSAAGGDKANPLGNFLLGEVVQNNSRKDPGMVKVEFTGWERGENISAWMPVLYQYAGKNHGQYLVPEIGDIVLVGFLGRMLEKPFVLGSFHPADGQLESKTFDANNRHRYMKTKGGVELDIEDADGKQKASVTTPKGLTISLEDQSETIKITDKNGQNSLELDCQGGKVELKANSKITLKTGSCTLEMDGQSGKIAVSGNTLELTGKQTAELKGNTSVKVEGGMLTAEGKQTAAFKGGTMTEVKGAMVKIN